MDPLRAQTLLAESRARNDRGALVLDVIEAIHEPVKVAAVGLRSDIVLFVRLERPRLRLLGWDAHRVHRKAVKAAKGRASVEVMGLHHVYALWAMIASTVLTFVIHLLR